MAKEKADAPIMLNGVAEIPITGSGSVVRNRMLRGAINSALEVYKLFDSSGENSPPNEAPSKRTYFGL